VQISASVTPATTPAAGPSLGPAASPVALRIGRRGGLDSLWFGALTLLVAAAGLVSCAQLSPEPPARHKPVAAASSPRVAAAVPRPAEPAPVPKHKPVPPPELAPAAVAPPAPPTRPSVDPARLVGLTEQETLRLLGPPTGTAEVPPAKYWQYASSRCVLRVFFFMQMDTRDFRTLSYEITSANHDPVIDQQCVADFVAPAGRP
jgi:hypothetical protein